MVISAPVHTKKVALGVFSNVVKIPCPFRLTVVVNCSRNVAVTVLWKVVMNGPTPVWSVGSSGYCLYRYREIDGVYTPSDTMKVVLVSTASSLSLLWLSPRKTGTRKMVRSVYVYRYYEGEGDHIIYYAVYALCAAGSSLLRLIRPSVVSIPTGPTPGRLEELRTETNANTAAIGEQCKAIVEAAGVRAAALIN